MSANRCSLALGAVTLACYTTLALGVATVDDSGDARGDAAADSPVIPRLHLAPIEGFTDDASYIRAARARATELALVADQAAEPTMRTDLLLAAANVILARELEPTCSAKLLGFSDDQRFLSDEEVGDALGRTDAILLEAEAAVGEVGLLASPHAEWIATATHQLTTLRAFAQGLQEYLLPREGTDASNETRPASSRLALLLEDDRPAVSAAAGLWQSCIRAREVDPTRAKSVLRLALARPRPGTLPFALFARLLRCRILASQDGYAAALALLTQLEDHADSWLDTDADRANALRTITLVEIQVLSDWQARLSGPPDSTQRRWCTDRISTLVDERFSEGGRSVFRLTTAIPIIVTPEDAHRRKPEARQGNE